MPVLNEEYDVVVVGAGHAGCEAALASARLGLNTIIFTVSMDSVAMMPCNPNVGGSSKGHLVSYRQIHQMLHQTELFSECRLSFAEASCAG